MGEFFKRAVRWIASAVLAMMALVMILVGVSDPKARAVGLGIGAVLALAAVFTWPRGANAWRKDRPSQRQLEYAADLGIQVPRGATKGEVSDMISAVAER